MQEFDSGLFLHFEANTDVYAPYISDVSKILQSKDRSKFWRFKLITPKN
jgi:hypothetical protein